MLLLFTSFGLALQLYFQIEPEAGVEAVKLKALIDLFDEIVEEPLFNQLRYFSEAESLKMC